MKKKIFDQYIYIYNVFYIYIYFDIDMQWFEIKLYIIASYCNSEKYWYDVDTKIIKICNSLDKHFDY